MWKSKNKSNEWCPENDGAYQAEQAAIHNDKADQLYKDLQEEWFSLMMHPITPRSETE